MKKKLLVSFGLIILFLLISVGAKGELVPCGQTADKPCKLEHLTILAKNVFDFIVFKIAVPLGALVIVAGGIVMLVSGGNPNLLSLAKRMLWGAVIGIFLVFGSWLIVYSILRALGYTGP